MIFGISTWFFQELTVRDAVDRIAAIGYGSAEVWAEHLNRTGESPEAVAKVAKSRNLHLTLHAPSYDLNPTAMNVGIRTESLRQIRISVETAARIGARCVVIHPGRLSSGRSDPAACWDALEEMFGKVDEWAAAEGVWAGIEAMERRPFEIYMLPADVERMLTSKRKRVGVTLDVAHAYTHMDPVSFISAIRPEWITHVHLSDGDQVSTHLPLGRGKIDIQAALTTLRSRYDGIVSIEGYVPGRGDEVARANIEYLRERGWA